MTRTSKMTLVSLFAVAAVGFYVSAVTPAEARSGLGLARPTMEFMMNNGSKFHGNTRGETLVQFTCQPGLSCYEEQEPQPLHAEPGTFWRLISICDYLDGTGISCVNDGNNVDDNN